MDFATKMRSFKRSLSWSLARCNGGRYQAKEPVHQLRVEKANQASLSPLLITVCFQADYTTHTAIGYLHPFVLVTWVVETNTTSGLV